MTRFAKVAVATAMVLAAMSIASLLSSWDAEPKAGDMCVHNDLTRIVETQSGDVVQCVAAPGRSETGYAWTRIGRHTSTRAVTDPQAALPWVAFLTGIAAIACGVAGIAAGRRAAVRRPDHT